MSQIYNIYCDESGHMENDLEKVMVLGILSDARWKKSERVKEPNEI